MSEHDPLCLCLVGKGAGPCCCWLLRQARAEGLLRGVEATVDAYNAGYATAEGRWSDAVAAKPSAYREGYNAGVMVRAKGDWLLGNQHGEGENP